MTKIDAHLHIDFLGLRIDSLVRYLDANQINSCWLLSWEELSSSNPRYQHLGPGDIYRAYYKYPKRVIPFYAPDPQDPEASQKLLHWHQKGFKGCGELKSSCLWSSPQVSKLLDTVSSLKMPVLFHMEQTRTYLAPLSSESNFVHFLFRILSSSRFGAFFPEILSLSEHHFDRIRAWSKRRTFFFPGYLRDFIGLEHVLKKFPSINFVGHGPLFWSEMYPSGFSIPDSTKELHEKGGISWYLMQKYDNLFADISCIKLNCHLASYPFLASEMVERFSDKLLYGSDNCSGHPDRFLKSLSISPETRKKILGENSTKLIC